MFLCRWRPGASFSTPVLLASPPLYRHPSFASLRLPPGISRLIDRRTTTANLPHLSICRVAIAATFHKSMADEKILSYNDVVLRRSDLTILRGPHFLNDRIIEFYFSYLSSHQQSDEILLAPPAITFWIANCTDEDTLKSFIAPLSLPSRNLVIFAVNDNEDVTLAEGGSHWSLLAFSRSHNIFVHHDSLGGLNTRYAKRVYKSVVRFMGCADSAAYVECDATPRQLNGYDCGLFVAAIARVLCSWYGDAELKGDGDLWFSVLKEKVTPLAVSEMRGEMLELIERLMAAK